MFYCLSSSLHHCTRKATFNGGGGERVEMLPQRFSRILKHFVLPFFLVFSFFEAKKLSRLDDLAG